MHKSNSSILYTKPALVVDLDDTLIHVTQLQPNDIGCNCFSIKVKRRKFYVQLRPNFYIFIERLKQLFDIFVFTSSTQEYANLIIDKILPDVKKDHRFFRDSCIDSYGYYVKDLGIVKRPLKRILLLDDSAGSALKNPKNLIRIRPWYGEKDDSTLISLIFILESIAFESDIRKSFIELIKNGNYEGINTF